MIADPEMVFRQDGRLVLHIVPLDLGGGYTTTTLNWPPFSLSPGRRSNVAAAVCGLDTVLQGEFQMPNLNCVYDKFNKNSLQNSM